MAAKTEESEGRLMDLVFRNVMVRFCLTWGVGVLMSKVIARWSEMVRSMLVRLLMVMPAVQTKSSVCAFFVGGKLDMLNDVKNILKFCRGCGVR